MTKKIAFAVQLTLVLTTIALACRADYALAHGGGGDIALYTNPGDPQLHVGFAVLDDMDIDHVFFDPNDKVLQSILIPRTPSTLPPIPYAIGSTEPGFDADEMELPELQELTYNTLDLQFWDGTGEVDFAPTTDISGGYAPQPSTTDDVGGFHAHPTFGLCDTSAASCDAGTVPDGLYLAELSVTVDGLEESEPYYLVALVDQSLYTGDGEMDAENAEMVGELVRDYLDDPDTAPEPVFGGRNYAFYGDAVAHAESLVIPEPATAGLLIVALAGALVSRRRLVCAK